MARLATMMSGPSGARFIVSESLGNSTGFNLPASGPGGQVSPGDFLIVQYFSGYTLSGGAGVAFTTSSFAASSVSSRRIEAADLATSFTFSGPGPYVLMIVRGPTSITTAPARSGTLTGNTIYPNQIAGVIPSSGAIGVVGFANAAGAGATEVYYHTKADVLIPGPFDVTRAEMANVYSYAMGLMVDLGGYSGQPFSINTEDTANTVTYRIHELF